MKNFLAIVILSLFYFNTVIAETKYSDLLILNKSSDPKKVIELVEKLTLGFEIETDFIEDCATYIKTFKTKSNDKCRKVLERKDSISRLLDIFGSNEFKTNMLNLSKKIDNGSIKFITGNELLNKLETLMKKNDEFINATKTVTFLMKNL